MLTGAAKHCAGLTPLLELSLGLGWLLGHPHTDVVGVEAPPREQHGGHERHGARLPPRHLRGDAVSPLIARSARLGVGQALLAAEAVPALRKQGHGRDVQARGAAKQAASLYRVGKVDLVHRVESKPSAVVQRAPPQEPRGLRTIKVGPVVLVERVPLQRRNSRWPAARSARDP